MSTKAEKLTFEAWLALPETKQPYVIIDGVLFTQPTLTPLHQAETIEVLRFSAEGSRVIDVFSIDGSLQSQVLGDFTLELREVFR